MRAPRPLARLLVVAPLAALVACADAVAPVAPNASEAAPSADRHASRGATVMRFEHGGIWVHWSPELEYTFTLGLVTAPSDAFFCGGAVRPLVTDGRWTTQYVDGPNGTVHLLDRLTEPATIVLYDGLLQAGQGLCGLADLPVLATGTVWMDRQTDNDLFGGTGPGANVWGRHLVGDVVLASGERARLLIVQRFVMRPGDPVEGPYGVEIDRIMLQPIGGR